MLLLERAAGAPLPITCRRALALAQCQALTCHLPVLVLVCVVLQPSLFGCNDGPGHSLVYYFALPEGWEPSQVRVTPSLPAPRLSPGRRSSVAAELLAGPGPTPALS